MKKPSKEMYFIRTQTIRKDISYSALQVRVFEYRITGLTPNLSDAAILLLDRRRRLSKVDDWPNSYFII